MDPHIPSLLVGAVFGYVLCFLTVIGSGLFGEWRRRRQWRPPINVDDEGPISFISDRQREHAEQMEKETLQKTGENLRAAELHEQARDRIRRGR